MDASYVSFSKVTVADLGELGASEVGVTEREVIFPLISKSSVSNIIILATSAADHPRPTRS